LVSSETTTAREESRGSEREREGRHGERIDRAATSRARGDAIIINQSSIIRVIESSRKDIFTQGFVGSQYDFRDNVLCGFWPSVRIRVSARPGGGATTRARRPRVDARGSSRAHVVARARVRSFARSRGSIRGGIDATSRRVASRPPPP